MQILLNGLIVGSAYALMGVGFSLIYSTVRYFNLAYGVIAVWGVYVLLFLMERFAVPFPIAVFLGALVSIVFGLGSYVLLFRPMYRRKSSPLVIMVASFGLLIILQNFASLVWGDTTKSVSLSDQILKGYEFFGMFITANQLAIAVTAVLMVVLLELFLQKTKIGMAIRAIGDNQELTKVLGIKTETIILWVYVLGSFLSAVSASMYALEIGVKPTYGVFFVIKAFIAAIIGGLGSVRGTLLGGLILGIAENFGVYVFGGQWQDTVAFVLLAVVLLWKPEGVFSKRRLVSIE